MKSTSKLTLLASALLLCTLATAQPSEYFLWKHKTNGKSMCEPDADANWIKVSGPYEDANCRILIKK